MKNQKKSRFRWHNNRILQIILERNKGILFEIGQFFFAELTELQKQGIINLLPKTGKDISVLENWRPISLLNVDYKIATKVIANRMKNVLPKLIHESQTGFMKGRYIGENIRLILETLEYADDQNLPGILFFSDFEKVFDSINHDYMFKCLRHFNFSDDLINWVKLFYKDAKKLRCQQRTSLRFFSCKKRGTTRLPFISLPIYNMH